MTCLSCNGSGQLIHFSELTRTFTGHRCKIIFSARNFSINGCFFSSNLVHKNIFVSDSNGIMKKLQELDGLVSVNGEIIMSEKAVRLQPLQNFEAVREKAKTEDQKIYRGENGIINDIERQVYSTDNFC